MQENKHNCVKSMRIVIISLLAISLLILIGCGANESFQYETHLHYDTDYADPSILVIQEGNLYGYGDTKGEVLIKPKYQDARPFCEGLAAVKYNGKYGYIDKSGKTVIQFKYNDALDFYNGKSIVGEGRFTHVELFYPISHVINTKGEVIGEEHQFTYISDISEDMFFAKTDKGIGQFYDKDYQPIKSLTKEYSGLSLFSDGLAMYSLTSASGCGYMDRTGKQAFPATFYDANGFHEGLAAVMPDGEKRLWGYIDKTGEMVISPAYSAARLFSEGLACVLSPEDKWLIIDPTGNEVADIQKKVYDAGVFSEGLCAVKTIIKRWKEDDLVLWGYTDASGKIAIDFKYDEVTPFKNGIAQVLVDDHIGYIDKTGKYIWEPK